MISKKKQLFIFNLIFILFFLYSSTISAFAQTQTYTITINCSGLEPIILSSEGTESGFDQLSNNVQIDLLKWLKEGVTEGEFLDETHRNLILLMLKDKYELSCTIPNNQTNIIGGVDETPAKSTPLKFTPEVGIPGFIGEKDVEDGFLLGNFLVALYKYLISLSGAVVVIILILGGSEWVFAGGDRGKISKAKERIKNAFIGMTLVSCSYLILYTINPAMLNIVPIKVGYIEPILVEDTTVDMGSMSVVPDGYSSAVATSNGICPAFITLDLHGSGRSNSGTDKCPDMGVVPGTSCQGSEIIAIASKYIGCKNGPCHCACFASSVLRAAGCGLPKTVTTAWCRNAAGGKPEWQNCTPSFNLGLMNMLLKLGWKIYPVGSIQAEAGDIVMDKGHVEIVYDSSGRSIGSAGRNYRNATGGYWHWGAKNYAGCSSMHGIGVGSSNWDETPKVIMRNPKN